MEYVIWNGDTETKGRCGKGERGRSVREGGREGRKRGKEVEKKERKRGEMGRIEREREHT